MADAALPRTGRVVCVAVPVYNGERYLGEALDSTLAQTWTDLDIVICDNASTDGTEEICRDYAARDSRIRYIRHPENIGAARNYIRGLELARSGYFRWQPADDMADPTLVERCMEILTAEPDVVQVCPRTILIDEDGQEIERYEDDLHAMDDRPALRYMKMTENLGLLNTLYGVMRTEPLRKARIHGSYLGADLVGQAEIALLGKIWQTDEYLFYRRMHREAHSAMTEAEKQAYYNPSNPAKRSYYQWRHLRERFASVFRSPVRWSEKLAISGRLLRRAISMRDELGREVAIAIQGFRPWGHHG